jgi:hypothetical protein
MVSGDEESKQIGLLKSSHILSNFVEKRHGSWNHGDWQELLKRVKEQNITVSEDKVGTLLEEERMNYFKKKSEISEKKEPEKIVLSDANFDKMGKKERKKYMKLWLIETIEGKKGV